MELDLDVSASRLLATRVHVQKGQTVVKVALEQGLVLMHPYIVGELACGNLERRVEVLDLLGGLPPAVVADHDEVLELVTRKRLHGRGVGWIDVHLLASAMLSSVRLWTKDRRLADVAVRLGISGSGLG
jgi:predicted nucleic acid-binding protein